MANSTKIVPVNLEDGSTVYVEATLIGEQPISFKKHPFKDVTNAIKMISSELTETLETIKPQKASVKFGLEIGIQSGKITTLIVQGSSKANVEITLHWESSSKNKTSDNS
ncbi:hypothetical protein NEA10_17645 [Phormidium yuhuli AB48]|uniref:Trypsin-co-occurring domain-containing protein n=1 Tax=Phormidium yuhuli AB48 TaxID=2940671 RepID=A0ABY5AN74_9CYAN|nr:CU044_2847 family protein [Phormidium yuhuli]USR90632.1 hypothetical protein NEA10_17645 [Phormidium yuhuli AB48]